MNRMPLQESLRQEDAGQIGSMVAAFHQGIMLDAPWTPHVFGPAQNRLSCQTARWANGSCVKKDHAFCACCETV